jgi:hypothetical protein
VGHARRKVEMETQEWILERGAADSRGEEGGGMIPKCRVPNRDCSDGYHTGKWRISALLKTNSNSKFQHKFQWQ